MLSTKAIEFLEARGLDPEMADRFGMYSPNITQGPGILIGTTGNVLAIPYFEDGVIVNEKFRVLPKQKFWQHSGRKKIFWNVDCLGDPALADGRMPLVITEGEFDALAAIQCGFPLSVSVPDGAPPASPHDDNEAGAIDQDGRFSFLWNARARLRDVKRFVLATDDDAPGHRLRAELMRLLMASRCSFVEYPMGCKDINDVLLKHGTTAVAKLLHEAIPCPVQGLYRYSEYPDPGPLETFSTGWPLLDRHFRPFLGEFVVVTGIPQSGKSSWVLNLLANMARIHGHRSAIFSPEMRVVPIIRDRLRSTYTGRVAYTTPETEAWIEDRFVFIGADPRGGRDEDNFSLEWIVQKATEAVLRDGIKFLLVDPWNEVEHAREKTEILPDYVSRGIRLLKRFAMLRNVTVIVVAHPTKMEVGKDGLIRCPTLYDISDAAHWFNKCDHGIVIYRNFNPENTDVRVAKSRFDEAGEAGSIKMIFDWQLHTFSPLVQDSAGSFTPFHR